MSSSISIFDRLIGHNNRITKKDTLTLAELQLLLSNSATRERINAQASDIDIVKPKWASAALYQYGTASPPQTPAAPLSSQQSSLNNDLYEAYDPLSRNPRRQQQYVRQQIQQQQTRPSTSGSETTTHTLRRTPKFDERTKPRPRAFSASVSDRPPIADVQLVEPAQLANPQTLPAVGPQSEQTEDTTTTVATVPPSRETWWPRRTTRISKRTANAILYALEVAIRSPFPFTSDEIEENASMADLTGAAGQGRRQYGRNTAGDNIPASTTPQPARPRGPKEIMKERKEREALKRLQQQEQNQIRTDRRAGVGEGGEGSIAEKRTSTGRTQYESQPQAQAPNRARTERSAKPDTSTGRPNVQPTQQIREASGPADTTRAQPMGNPNPPRSQPNTTDPPRNSSSTFPHAFERWETLSSHWEGLTSFWIKRLQGNSAELNGQPINQQLARQVTDLSAAGANLFHAVVELQRLRASSERKFQRWFFEVRDDQEKTAERIAQLEADLTTARQGQPIQPVGTPPPSPEEIRKQAEQLAAEEIEKIKRQCALEIKEKNRELEISREEARRSWEEIGRLEQRDRDRTFSLRRGEPTVLGGVQVVPFQAEGSRQARGQAGGLSQHPPETGATAYTAYDATRSETDTDPFTEGGYDGQAPLQGIPTSSRQPQTPPTVRVGAESRSPARPRTAGQPFSTSSTYASNPQTSATSGGFYKQSGVDTTLHPTQSRAPGQDARAYTISEHSEDDYQVDDERAMHDLEENPVGQRTNPPSEISDEYDVLAQLSQGQMFTRGLPENYGQTERYTTSNGGSYQAPDYSGSGYGREEWEGVPQHHHPSRLSNILEEDERSRTSETSRRLQH